MMGEWYWKRCTDGEEHDEEARESDYIGGAMLLCRGCVKLKDYKQDRTYDEKRLLDEERSKPFWQRRWKR
jgi:hypothetical protein